MNHWMQRRGLRRTMPQEEAAVRAGDMARTPGYPSPRWSLAQATETRDGTVSTWQVTPSDTVRTCEERFGNVT
ncbi:hypothetical protein DHEL01_v205037 [Diaporthe helianthi]|uniref:Uncharacterized protein n=1 Tax=Diaporthe helianthi TaxID=158607 RepID=A0A2P5I285_DIAHE|nr:hypothetical protein DHEL01_v205037 [Diaporthe helianthi]